MESRRAIIVIDMQNDFVLPDAPLSVAGAYATLPAIERFLDYGRSMNWPVIYVCRHHRKSGVDAETFRRHFFTDGNPVCVPGSRGAEVVNCIAPLPNDIVISKHRFSAFFATDLDMVLRNLGIRRLYLTGTQYPNCIRSTAVDAMSLDYEVCVVTDCCSAASDEVAKANIYDMRNMGISCDDSAQIMI